MSGNIDELTRVKYIGASRAETLVEDYGVESIGDLISMAESGRLREMGGIGEKREKAVLRSARNIERVRTEEDEETEAVDDGDEDEEKSSEAPPREPVELFLERLRCPACGEPDLDRNPATLRCRECGREFNFYNGIADLAPSHPSDRNLAQRVMEFEFYSEFYEDFMRPRLTALVSDRSIQEEYELSADFLELDSDSTVLDVACGTGNFTRYFMRRLKRNFGDEGQYLVTGMDLAWPMLEKARSLLTQRGLDREIYLIRGDALRIPVQRGSFDRLHCSGALHIMNNIDEALRNFSRVLEKGGICVIGTFLLGDGFVRRAVKKAAEVPSQFHWFGREELHQRLQRAGFEVLDESIAGDAITLKARRT